MRHFREMDISEWLGFLKLKRLVIPFSCYILGLLINSSFSYARLLVPLYGIILYSGVAVLNDIHDLDIDRFSNPFRPLPRGKLSLKKSYMITVVLIATGAAYSLFIAFYFSNFYFLFFPAVHLLLGYMYSKYFSKHYILAMTVLGFTHGLLPYVMAVFMFGSFSTLTISVGISIYLSLALTYLIKDFKDESGDRLKRKTLLTVFGIERAKKITFLAFLPLSLIAIVPYLVFGGSRFFLILSFSAWVGLMLVIYFLFRSRSEERYEFILDVYRYVIAGYILSFALL